MTKKKGAQPGNVNALKHGLYSDRFTLQERTKLLNIDKSLNSEIDLLRVMIDRYISSFTSIENPTQSNYLEVITNLSLVMIRLASLIRTEMLLPKPKTGITDLIDQALSEIFKELSEVDPQHQQSTKTSS